MKVEETYRIKAPFFGYATISEWSEQSLPDSIQTIQQLEEYLDSATKTSPRPFMFKLSGVAEEALIHIVNLPEGTEVRSPAEAHQGQTDYPLYNEEFEIVGFFSTEHQRIFTHHDTYRHMHLITTDSQEKDHLDDVLFDKGTLNQSPRYFASNMIAEEENGTELCPISSFRAAGALTEACHIEPPALCRIKTKRLLCKSRPAILIAANNLLTQGR